MKISVGIHQNVILVDAAVNEKGRLELFWRGKDEKKSSEDDDPFAKMNASEVIEEDKASIILWPFKLADAKDKQGNERSQEEIGKIANGDVTQLKNQLQQILEQYLTKDQIKWSVYDGAAMSDPQTYKQDPTAYYRDMASQANLDVIYRNLAEQFISMARPFFDNNEYPMRLKLARQNKDKHFARIPGMFIKDNPFIEPMTVPEASTRVKWTTYELKEKLNDGTPVSRDTADNDEEIPESDSPFGQR